MLIKLTERLSNPPKPFWISPVYIIRLTHEDSIDNPGEHFSTRVQIATPQYSDWVYVCETPEQINELIIESRKE